MKKALVLLSRVNQKATFDGQDLFEWMRNEMIAVDYCEKKSELQLTSVLAVLKRT